MNDLRSDEIRLTNEQRDRVLHLAARLQAQHDGTVAVGDLAQAASQVGIDPRFVHEAARSVVQPPQTLPPRSVPSADRLVAGALLGLLATVDVVLVLTPLGRVAEGPGMIWGLLLAALAGHFAVKGRLPVWLVPAMILAVLLGTSTLRSLIYVRPDSNHVASMMLMEAAVAFLAGLVAAASAHFRQSSRTR